MYELAVFLNAKLLELVFDEVLNSFNIVICNLLNLLYFLCILCRKILIDSSQSSKVLCREAFKLLQRKLT